MSDPRRCAFFVPSLDGGGAELMTLRLASGFAARGLPTDLVVARARGPYLERVPDSVRLVDLDARTPVLLTKTGALTRYLRRERPQALLSTLDIVSSASLARMAARTPTRVVITVRTNLSQQFADKPVGARVRKALVRLLYPRADQLVAVSRGTADDVARLAGLAPERVRVIYNPAVPEDLERQVAQPVAHPWLAGGQPPVVLSVGRLVRQKDFGTLIRAFAVVRREREARLLILGGADPREAGVPGKLAALARSLGLEDDIDLAGFAPNPIAHMARASVFALSSLYEGFGNVLVEALAAGTPIVSTACPSGPAEILGDGRWGRLVPVGDAAAMGRALLETLRSAPPKSELLARAEAFRLGPAVDQYVDAAQVRP